MTRSVSPPEATNSSWRIRCTRGCKALARRPSHTFPYTGATLWATGRALTAVLVGFAILVSGTFPSSAQGDGDPASDYLIGQQVFLPYASTVAPKAQSHLIGTVAAANQRGFAIRVALIPTSFDLGSITALWRQPQTYARFLDTELSFVYKGRLLIVMPNGFGFAWLAHPTTVEYQLLATIPIGTGAAGIMAAAQAAVQKLAAAGNVTVHATAAVGGKSTNSVNPILIVALALTVSGLTVGARVLVRRRGIVK